jgi:hypothetical protein
MTAADEGTWAGIVFRGDHLFLGRRHRGADDRRRAADEALGKLFSRNQTLGTAVEAATGQSD